MIRDGDWVLFDWDPESGRSVWALEQDGQTIYRVDYPMEATLSQNKMMRDMAGAAWKGDWHQIASIPLNIFFDADLGLAEATRQDDHKYLSRWLNDSDNRAFRTKEGNV